MKMHIATASVLALTLVSCKTTSASSSSEIAAAKSAKELRFNCKNETDKTSKKFRPNKMTDNIDAVIVMTSDWKSIAIEIGPKGSKPLTSPLTGISGDEGYSELTTAKDVESKYGFGYVIIFFDEEDASQTPTHAGLVNGGIFSTCTFSKKK